MRVELKFIQSYLLEMTSSARKPITGKHGVKIDNSTVYDTLEECKSTTQF